MSSKMFRQINAMPSVQKAVHQTAEKVAARARQINSAEGGTAKITVVKGIRPGGRAYANVVSDNPEEEYGSSTQRKLAQVRRAALGG